MIIRFTASDGRPADNQATPPPTPHRRSLVATSPAVFMRSPKAPRGFMVGGFRPSLGQLSQSLRCVRHNTHYVKWLKSFIFLGCSGCRGVAILVASSWATVHNAALLCDTGQPLRQPPKAQTPAATLSDPPPAHSVSGGSGSGGCSSFLVLRFFYLYPSAPWGSQYRKTTAS